MGRFNLDGGMIPRQVKRMFDERGEPRFGAESRTAAMLLDGGKSVVRLVNLSSSGAMVIFPGVPHIGAPVTLQLMEHGAVEGHVRWVRDGRVGINFVTPLE